MKTDVCFIYALVDPRDGVVRYVGKTIKKLERRLAGHLNEKKDTRKFRWIQTLLQDGLTPKIKLIDTVPSESWEEHEIKWIAWHKANGFDLTNTTSGGDGVHDMTQESRDKVARATKKRMNDSAFRAKIFTVERSKKISLAQKGVPHSAEHVANLPQNQKGYKHREDFKKKVSLGLMGNKLRLGKPITAENKEKIAVKLRGNQHTKGRVMPEHEKVQRSLAQKGRPKTTEHREKQRLGALKRWERERKNKEINDGN